MDEKKLFNLYDFLTSDDDQDGKLDQSAKQYANKLMIEYSGNVEDVKAAVDGELEELLADEENNLDAASIARLEKFLALIKTYAERVDDQPTAQGPGLKNRQETIESLLTRYAISNNNTKKNLAMIEKSEDIKYIEDDYRCEGVSECSTQQGCFYARCRAPRAKKGKTREKDLELRQILHILSKYTPTDVTVGDRRKVLEEVKNMIEADQADDEEDRFICYRHTVGNTGRSQVSYSLLKKAIALYTGNSEATQAEIVVKPFDAQDERPQELAAVQEIKQAVGELKKELVVLENENFSNLQFVHELQQYYLENNILADLNNLNREVMESLAYIRSSNDIQKGVSVARERKLNWN